ncbi:DUF5655 domain-containing protein [Actinokineospora fastidiosa]|uniref:DUF5655 domain-containing protein n=1 Tax=Actinokineospora fastidiosa TaxID=1816 RepID=A0A918LC80_9PSEU|nr:DUF5655 domain-containing protein [Actinokineospora fastidiosa]GGS28635.1 hypothetical protein GCM10010171_22180 [Actinokineospora fastidiosa]
MTIDEFLDASPFARAVHERLRTLLDDPYTVQATKSQLAYRRARGFAYLWLPGRYLRNPGAEVVLSIVLPRRSDSARFKEVAHPAPGLWIHHLEIHDVTELDAEVAAWLREAAEA